MSVVELTIAIVVFNDPEVKLNPLATPAERCVPVALEVNGKLPTVTLAPTGLLTDDTSNSPLTVTTRPIFVYAHKVGLTIVIVPDVAGVTVGVQVPSS